MGTWDDASGATRSSALQQLMVRIRSADLRARAVLQRFMSLPRPIRALFVTFVAVVVLFVTSSHSIFSSRNPTFNPSVWHTFEGSFNKGAPFTIALPDPQRDHNTRVIRTNWYEDALGDAFRVVLSQRCTSADYVIDIGANLGIFSATSAAFGCSVLAVEAQTRHVPFIRATAAANGWGGGPGDRMEVRAVAVYDKPGALRIAYHTPAANASGWLSMAMDEQSLAECPSQPGCAIESVPVVEGHTLITRDTLLLKIDVDGPEARIVKSVLPALATHTVENILMEICPPFWRDISRQDGMDILRQLPFAHGYEVVLLDQISFDAYKPGFLERCRFIDGVFRPKAYAMPAAMFDELFDDTTTSVNCKNVLFTLDLTKLVNRWPGGVVLEPVAPPVAALTAAA